MTHQLPNDRIQDFVLAGKALFTVLNTETEGRFTYKVTRAPEKDKDGTPYRASLWFVKVLTGSDNTSAYSFIGTFQRFGDGPVFFRHSRKSPISERAVSVQGAVWLAARLTDGQYPAKMAVYHEGRCGRCGRVLTVPESIETGLGPSCAKKTGRPMVNLSLVA